MIKSFFGMQLSGLNKRLENSLWNQAMIQACGTCCKETLPVQDYNFASSLHTPIALFLTANWLQLKPKQATNNEARMCNNAVTISATDLGLREQQGMQRSHTIETD